MKRNTFLAFLLIGITVMEWGCEKDEVSYSVTHTIEGVNSATWHKYRPRQWFRYYRHDSLMLQIEFQTLETKTMVRAANNTSVYALSPAEHRPENTIDSILIYSNGVDYTNRFTTFFKEEDLRAIDKYLGFGYTSPLTLQLGIKEPLSNFEDTFQFNLKFYDIEGNVFETTTDPVVIRP